MPSVSLDLTPYFPLSVPFSALARQRYKLSLEPPRPTAAESLYYLRLAGAKLPTTVGGGAQLNLLAQLNRVLRKLGERFLDERISAGYSFDRADLQPGLQTLLELFPPQTVLRGEPSAAYLTVGTSSHRQTLLELFLLALQNDNPAAANLRSLFDDKELQQRCSYRQLLVRLDALLTDESEAGALGTSLTALLWAPIKASPHSLADQLNYVRRHWAEFLPADLLLSIDSAFDVLASEEQQRGWGPPQVPVPHYPAAATVEPEHGTDRQNNLRLARPALPPVRSAHSAPVGDSRRRDRSAGTTRLHCPVADRPMGTLTGLAADQAHHGQPRGRGVGLFPLRLHCR